MKLQIKDIINRHKDFPAVVMGHGPSFNQNKDKILSYQLQGELIRFSINDWFNIVSVPPTYWITANSVDTPLKYHQLVNRYKIPFFFADTVDLCNLELLDSVIQGEYLNYDQRHFKQHNCPTIIGNFIEHKEKTGTYENYFDYGNNDIQWYPPRSTDPGPGWSGFTKKLSSCCGRISNRLTIQEELQQYTGYKSHYSTGDTAIIHHIAFAILMGCNPIFLSGMDLDYSAGYANGQRCPEDDFWVQNKNVINDLTILNESAKMVGTKIVSLNDTWYGIFEKGKLI